MRKRSLYCFLLAMMMLLGSSPSAMGQSQQVTINVRNVSLKTLFQEIEKRSTYRFSFRNALLEGKSTVTFNRKASVKDLLTEVLSQRGLSYTMASKNSIVIVSAQKTNGTKTVQQGGKKKVTGRIVDENGEPIIGATVKEKGTLNGTITDADGNFSFDATPNSTLQVTYIGYKTQDVQANDNLNLTMASENEELNEVIVVGYGTAKKSDLAGSVVRADLSNLKEYTNVSLGSALQGTIPGLNVGAVTSAGSDPSMSIRGRSSISGTTSPLIVLDGIIYNGSLVDLNTNDIQSIDVLKDASAAAIYGSQASNGVILITTKTGGDMSKPIIEYNGSFTIQQASHTLDINDREGYLQKIADTFISESRTGDDLLSPNPNWDVTKHFAEDKVLDGYNNGTDTDWYGLLTNSTPYIQNHSLSVRGKSELSNYYFSAGFTDQKNLIVNDTYKRYNVRVNLDTKITKDLKVGLQSFFTTSNYSGASPSMSTVYDLPPLTAPYDENGELVKMPFTYYTNPLMETKQRDSNKRFNLSGIFYVDLQIPFIKGLSYRLNFSQSYITTRHFNFNEMGANFTGTAYKSNGSRYNWTVDNILTYKRDFGKHSINSTLVYGADQTRYESTTASGQNYPNNVLGYNCLESGQADLQSASSSAWRESSLYSMFRVMYSYDNKYMFTGTIRRDGFSGFGKDNKFGWFPSAAVAWRISEEKFMEKFSWLDNLKLRLSYGQNGNRTIGRYQTMAKLGSTTGYLFGDGANAEQMQWVSSLENNNLKWETTNTFNLGLDFSVLSGRLTGTIDYYTSKTNNLLFNINIPNINGFSSVPSNIGKLSNHGIEVSLTGIPVKTKDLTWSVTFNFSQNRNKVDKVFGIDNDGDGKEDDLISNKIFIGKPYGVCYDYNIIGMWQISDYQAGLIPKGFTYGTYKVEDINGDGAYTAADDRKILGYTDPSYRFSISSNLHYKDWSLSFLLNSIQGGKDHYYGQPGSGLANPDNIAKSNLFKFDYWTPENPNAKYRQLGYYTSALGSSFSPYQQRNFIRLQDLTVAYNVPSSLLNKFNIRSLKIYLTGKNLFTITSWDGLDPETGTGLWAGYPVIRSYTIGLNFEF